MKTKKNDRKPVRKHGFRIIKSFTIIALTVVALVATSIIGPTSRSGKVKAFGTATLDLQNLTFTDSFGTTSVQWINSTVPGFPYNIAKYHRELSNEGVRGDVDPDISRFNIACPDPYGFCTGGVCTNLTGPVTDDSLGNQTFAADPTNSALDHKWVQGRPGPPLIYELQASSSNAIIFPASDHRDGGMYENVEVTVWGYTGVGTPDPTAFPTGWIQGRLSRVYQDGWQQHTEATYAQSFDGGDGNVFPNMGFETDDFASVWSFINPTTNQPLSVVFVAVYSNKSLTVTPNLGNPYESENCPNGYINDGFADGIYTSDDCEIDAVATSAAITGCIDPSCQPQLNFCSYTPGKFNANAKNTVAKYLQNNFGTLFPSGLTIGEADGGGSLHNATWTNVTNLRTFIGTGGTSGVLTADTSNATSTTTTGGGNLASQVAALTINIRLSGSGGGQPAGLGNAVICNTGTSLDGKSVQTILDQANKFLAGDPGYNLGLSAGSLTALVDSLNRSFDDCVKSQWATMYLCPPSLP